MSTDRPRVLVVVNSPGSGPRRLLPWLAAAGADPTVVAASEGLPGSLDGFAGLVLLGGGLMPDDDAEAPWLAAERDLATEAIDADLPTLGICLGGQLLAHVAGGRVRARFGTPERGATAVSTTADGSADPVLGALAPTTHVVENHKDTITELPPTATLLASSEVCRIQAFRIGQHVRGLQFHPEASADDLARWDEAALAADGVDLAALVAVARRHDDLTAERCRAMVAAFAAELAVVARAG